MEEIQNCWDIMKCGFGPKGPKTKTHGVCPAAQENKLDRVHKGIHGGRACWFVDNTFGCGKDVPGDFSNKFPICMNCEFYLQVRDEEDSKFEVSLLLNTYLQNK